MESVRSLNPAIVIDRHCANLSQSLDNALDGAKIDVVADVVAGANFSSYLSTLNKHGRYVTAGAIGSAVVPVDVRTLYLKFLTFYGASCGMPWHFEKVLEHIQSGQIKPIFRATYPLEKIHQAQKDFMNKGFFGNLVVLPS